MADVNINQSLRIFIKKFPLKFAQAALFWLLSDVGLHVYVMLYQLLFNNTDES